MKTPQLFIRNFGEYKGQQTRWSKESFKRNIPVFFDCKTVLYIGPGINFQNRAYLKECGFEVTLLDIWSEYVNKWKEEGYEAILADIVIWEAKRKWDIVMWWHGPEHVSEQNLPKTFKKLEMWANKLVILSVPWGYLPLGRIHDNPHYKHKCHLKENFFLALGYSVEVYGSETNTRASNLVAWKEIENE